MNADVIVLIRRVLDLTDTIRTMEERWRPEEPKIWPLLEQSNREIMQKDLKLSDAVIASMEAFVAERRIG